MLKFNGPNSISKDALRDENRPWLINCTTQEYLVNMGLDSHFNTNPHMQFIYIGVSQQYSRGEKHSSLLNAQVAMGGLDEYKPAMAMLGLQFSYAAVAVFTRAALVQGMSPRVFVVYRQAIATLVISPIAYFSRCLYLNSSLSISYIEK